MTPTELIAEARELIEALHAGVYDDEYIGTGAYLMLDELCDALEQSQATLEQTWEWDMYKAAQKEIERLRKELAALASESVKRDIALAKLEAEVAAAIEAQNAQRWIPVTERLPEHDGFVLILSKDKMDGTEQVNISAYTYVGFGGERLASKEWSAPYECFHKHDTVTHWMPLPQPPEGED